MQNRQNTPQKVNATNKFDIDLLIWDPPLIKSL